MNFSPDDGNKYDVVEVSTATYKVRLLAEGKTLPDAEAVVAMAVMRRGVEGCFYAETPTGSLKDGDKWRNIQRLPPTEDAKPAPPEGYYRIGNTLYPSGPRGLAR